jgi:hypothetical protein
LRYASRSCGAVSLHPRDEEKRNTCAREDAECRATHRGS